jgi:hypothetical protein
LTVSSGFVLSQFDGLLAFKLTSQDRDALYAPIGEECPQRHRRGKLLQLVDCC